MENSALVAEEESLQQLVSVGLHQHRVHLTVLKPCCMKTVLWKKNSNLGHVGVHVLLEVHGKELKDEVELGLLHENVLEGDDVGVLQLLQQGYLADGS